MDHCFPKFFFYPLLPVLHFSPAPTISILLTILPFLPTVLLLNNCVLSTSLFQGLIIWVTAVNRTDRFCLPHPLLFKCHLLNANLTLPKKFSSTSCNWFLQISLKCNSILYYCYFLYPSFLPAQARAHTCMHAHAQERLISSKEVQWVHDWT